MDDKQKSEVESTNEETEVEIEETQPTETEEVEEIEEESEQSPDEPTEAEPEDEPEREVVEEKPSRRESLRIQQVLEKVKRGDYAPQQQPQPQGMDYADALDADPEVVQQLEADRQAYAQQSYQQGAQLAQSNLFHTRLEIDAPKVEAKYPQLDKNSPDFDPAVADAVNNWYLSTTGYDPQTNTVQSADVRYADFVEGIMELAERAAGEKVARSSKNIAKQAASTGLRPDGSSAKSLDLSKAPGDMTNEELDAIIKSNLK